MRGEHLPSERTGQRFVGRDLAHGCAYMCGVCVYPCLRSLNIFTAFGLILLLAFRWCASLSFSILPPLSFRAPLDASRCGVVRLLILICMQRLSPAVVSPSVSLSVCLCVCVYKFGMGEGAAAVVVGSLVRDTSGREGAHAAGAPTRPFYLCLCLCPFVRGRGVFVVCCRCFSVFSLLPFIT